MYITKENEEQFKKQMLKLFEDKLNVQTKPPQKMVNFKFNFKEKNLEAIHSRLKEHGIKKYRIKNISNYEYVLTINNFILDSSKYEFIQNFQDIIYSWGTKDCYQDTERGFSTFVLDAKYKDIINPIVKKVLDTDITELGFINVAFKEYNIDGLIWFTIDCDILIKGERPENCPSYLLLCYLMDCHINHFSIRDRDGKLYIDVRSRNFDETRNNQHGFRLDLNDVYRSSWEANLARILNYLKIPFKFEVEGFDLDSDLIKCYYLPDFFLPDNKIIELKGFWDEYSRKKVKTFTETQPNYELMILDGDMYTTLDKMYSHKIPNWEFSSVNFTKETLPVIGITRPERRSFVKKLKVGDRVQLVREKDNQYDPYAIKILDDDNNHIGYIAAVWAFIYASKMDIGMIFEGIVKEIESKVIKIQVRRINTEEVIIYEFLKDKIV